MRVAGSRLNQLAPGGAFKAYGDTSTLLYVGLKYDNRRLFFSNSNSTGGAWWISNKVSWVKFMLPLLTRLSRLWAYLLVVVQRPSMGNVTEFV